MWPVLEVHHEFYVPLEVFDHINEKVFDAFTPVERIETLTNEIMYEIVKKLYLVGKRHLLDVL